MKVSEFLKELDSHGIYKADTLAAEFTEKTGKTPCWPVHRAADAAAAIQTRRLGGQLGSNDPQEKLAYGYEIAEALANLYGAKDNTRQYPGRATRFRDAIERIVRAGN